MIPHGQTWIYIARLNNPPGLAFRAKTLPRPRHERGLDTFVSCHTVEERGPDRSRYRVGDRHGLALVKLLKQRDAQRPACISA